MAELDGKVVIIVGASRGLGRAMALGFAREKAAVVLAARSLNDLEQVATECKSAGSPSATVVATDVCQEEQVANLVSKTIRDHGRLDVLVANAATSAPNLSTHPMSRLESYSYDVAERLLEVNTLGVWLAMKHALPVMSNGGSFIAVGAGFGGFQRAGAGFLGVSKAAVSALVQIAAAEWSEQGIRVNELTPGGMVDTHLFGPNGIPSQLKQRLRVLEPEVVVPAAIWLASDASSDVTGTSTNAVEFNSGNDRADD